MNYIITLRHYQIITLANYSVTVIDTPSKFFVMASAVTTRTLLYVPVGILAGIFSTVRQDLCASFYGFK